MSSGFDWQTEQEDDAWNASRPPRPSPKKRRWWPMLAALMMVIIVGGLVYWQIARRATAVETTTRADVLTSHALLVESSAKGDRDLLLALLSGSNPGWTNAALSRLLNDRWADRTGFDLTAASLPPTTTPTNTWIAPDLQGAAVQTPRPYTYQRGAGASEPVQLLETAFYRRGTQRWLLAPAEPDYWGSRQTQPGQRLTVHFPERDAEIATRLAADLDALLVALCRDVPQRCDADWQFDLTLDAADPQRIDHSLLDSTAVSTTLILPTPTLVGLPVDEAGYDVLRESYGRHVATAVLADWSAFNCCLRGGVLRALVDYTLADLDYAPWPLTPAAYDRLFSQWLTGASIDNSFLAQSMAASTTAEPYALVAFTRELAPDRTPFELIDDLSIYVTAWGWLDSLDGEPDDRLLLSGDWLDFLNANTSWATTAVAPPAPSHDIEAICWNRVPRRLLLNTDTNAWRSVQRFDTSDSPTDFLLDPVPGIAGSFVVDNGRVIYRHPTGDLPVLDLPESDYDELGLLGLLPSGPHNDWLLLFYPQPGTRDHHYWLLDPADCDDGDCAFTAVVGWPTWSPGGTFVLWEGDTPIQISTDDLGTDRLPISSDAADAFWLDDTHVGLLETTRSGALELAVIDLFAWAESARFTVDDILAAADDDRLAPARLGSVQPAQPGQIEVTLQTDVGGRTAVVTFDHTLQTILSVRVAPDEQRLQALAPGGGHAVRLRSSPTSPMPDYVLTAANGRVITSFPFDHRTLTSGGWSPDGTWYAQTYQAGILLIHARTGYQRIMTFPPGTDCYRTAWVPRGIIDQQE